MKKSVWIFLFAVLLPGVVLGWLALRSADEQRFVFERRTAELYQKETEALAVTVRDAVETERHAFGETVHRLLANGDADALARDFANTLADAWPVKSVGFVINREGKLVSPSVAGAAKNSEWRQFLLGNGSFLTSTEPAMVYNWQGDNQARSKTDAGRLRLTANNDLSATRNDEGNAKLPGKDLPNETKSVVVGGKMKTPIAGAEPTAAVEKDRGVTRSRAPLAQDPGVGAGGVIRPADDAKVAPAAPAPVPEKIVSNPARRPESAAQPVAAPRAETAQSAATANALHFDSVRRNESAPGARPPGAAPASMTSMARTKSAASSAPASAVSAPAPMAGAAARTLKPPADFPTRALRDGIEEKKETEAVAPMPGLKPMPAKTPQTPPVELAKKAELSKALVTDNEAAADAAQKFANLQNNAINRQVEPQQLLNAPGAALSTVLPETTQFCQLTQDSEDGMVARFAEDKLNLIFWLRPPEAPEMVFGCLIEAGHFSDVWRDVLERHRSSPRGSARALESQPEFVLALLDDRGKPVATQPAAAAARDWKHPFVASEIGEALPHWEAALYLASPTALAESARGLWRTLAFTIAGAVALIAIGGWLVVADARRQLALAQQKTDFVSNVSHELKTPLTSIRMFAELMHDRPQSPEKQGQYLRIITVEAERLTRLINNVLDFAKIGRAERHFEKKPLDLHALLARVWESQELHLREAGFTTRCEAAPGAYPVLGDEDALAQVLVNLLSNAEKYSTVRKEVELHAWLEDAHANIAVMDRGMGVPNGDDRKIFEAFYRAHDSLNSGVQGSGLGLTLAQRIAREHGGEIRFERREGGGCRFTLRVPLEGGRMTNDE